MGFKLFKTGDDHYAESMELIKRGEYSKARNSLVKSITKEGGIDDVAAVQVALIDLSDKLVNPGAYDNVVNKLDKLTSATEIEFGLDHIPVDDLRTECVLTAKKLRLLSSESNDPDTTVQKGQELLKTAQDFQAQIGPKSLIVSSVFKKNTSVTGNTEFYNLMAVAYETMADGTVYNDPSKAAEYQQIAAGYRQQNGQSAEDNMRKVREYAATCTCWVCGRVATGQGIHFFAAPADVSPCLQDSASTAARTREDTKHIFICRACYTAVSNRSNEISKAYYDDAMQKMREMEARLQAQIAAAQTQASMAYINSRN